MQYGQNIGTEEYGRQLGYLGNLASMGQQASATTGGYLSNIGTQTGQMYGNLAQLQAQLQAQKGLQKAQLLGALAGGAMSGYGQYKEKGG